MPLTLDSLRTHVRDRLGRGMVRVELTDDNIDAAIRDATRLFNKYLPQRKRAVLPLFRRARQVHCLANWYTFRVAPLVSPGADRERLLLDHRQALLLLLGELHLFDLLLHDGRQPDLAQRDVLDRERISLQRLDELCFEPAADLAALVGDLLALVAADDAGDDQHEGDAPAETSSALSEAKKSDMEVGESV